MAVTLVVLCCFSRSLGFTLNKSFLHNSVVQVLDECLELVLEGGLGLSVLVKPAGELPEGFGGCVWVGRLFSTAVEGLVELVLIAVLGASC